jgi:hypothetical protein
MTDTFGVAIHVTEEDLQFLVRVPTDIDSGWTDPESFQRLAESAVWETLDKDETLRAVVAATEPGETVSLGTVALDPDGTLVGHDLSVPTDDSDVTADPTE